MARKKAPLANSPVDCFSQSESCWLVLKYLPVSLFSLRSTMSTNKGGKALLVPTPYAVKMAVIDAAFRVAGSDRCDLLAREVFERVKARSIRFRPPSECVVQNTFVKIRQEQRDAPAGSYVSTIAYREMVFFRGELEIAIDVQGLSEAEVGSIRTAGSHVNYFGKRGSFFQFVESAIMAAVPSGFSLTMNESLASMPIGVYGISQFLDDFGPELCNAKDGFERISTFHESTMTLNKHRVLTPTLLPYRMVEATRSFTRYIRSETSPPL